MMERRTRGGGRYPAIVIGEGVWEFDVWRDLGMGW